MKLVTIPVSKINPASYNPRKDLKPTDEAYIILKNSMDTFGYIDPCVWNKRTGNLVGGDQRFKILVNDYHKTEIEVSEVNLEPEQEKLLNIALNKIRGEWDPVKLSELLKAIDGDKSITGFSNDEIKLMTDEPDLSTFFERQPATIIKGEDPKEITCPFCERKFKI